MEASSHCRFIADALALDTASNIISREFIFPLFDLDLHDVLVFLSGTSLSERPAE